MNKNALIILTFNEIEGSKAVYEDIPFDLFDKVLVIDGGSQDGTIDFWLDQGHDVVLQDIKGRGSAFILANNLVQTEYFVFFSPDGNENPSDIPKLITEIEAENTDLVIATRFGKGGKSEDAGLIRSFGNKMFTWMIRLFFRAKVTDAVNGFRAIKQEKFNQLKLPNSKFEIEFQMTVRSGKLKYNIVEIPTFEADRIGGFSKAGTLSVGFAFVKLFLKELFIGKRFLNQDYDHSSGDYKLLESKQ